MGGGLDVMRDTVRAGIGEGDVRIPGFGRFYVSDRLPPRRLHLRLERDAARAIAGEAAAEGFVAALLEALRDGPLSVEGVGRFEGVEMP